MASRLPLRTASVSSSTDSPTSAGPPGGVPQSITALLNNPLPSAAAASYSWLPWPPPNIALPEAAPTPPSHPCEVTRADFAPYLAAVSDPYARFADIRLHATAEHAASSDAEGTPAASSGLAACLREVPALFFKEDFALEDGPTFQAACPLDDDGLQERLGQHLDVVEAHLVREIALRSESRNGVKKEHTSESSFSRWSRLFLVRSSCVLGKWKSAQLRELRLPFPMK